MWVIGHRAAACQRCNAGVILAMLRRACKTSSPVNRYIPLRFLCISALALLMGFTLAAFLVQATAWSIALTGGLALCSFYA